MADATTQDLKDLFAHVPDLDPVTNQQLTDLAAWYTSHTGKENPTPNDFIRSIHELFSQQVVSFKRAKSSHEW